MTDHPPQTKPSAGAELIAKDSRDIFGNTGRATTGQAIALAAGLVTTIITIRLLQRADYGRFALFFMLLEIISHFISWPNLGIVRFGREEMAHSGRAAQTFWARMLLYAAGALAAAVILWTFRKPAGEYLHLEYPLHALLFLYVTLNGFVLLARSMFQTTSQFRAYAFTAAGVKICNLALILTLFLFLRLPVGPGRIIAVHIASFALVCMLCVFLLPWKLLLPIRTDLRAIRRIAAYSWPLLPAGLCAFVVNWVDLAVIRHFGKDWEVGVYAAAYQPVTILIALHVAVLGVITPLLVSLVITKRKNTLVWYLREALPQLGWLLGLGALVLALSAEFIPLVLGAAYRPAIVPCQVLIAGAAFFTFAGFQSSLVTAFDRTRAVFIVGLLTATLNVLFDLALVPRFGILGAAVGTTAAFILSGLLYFPILNTALPASPRRYLALAGLTPALLMAGIIPALPSRHLRIALCILLIGASISAARLILPRPRATLDKLDAAHLPNPARKAIRIFLHMLSR